MPHPALMPEYLESVLVAGAVTIEYVTLPSAALSFTPVMVTV